MISGRIHTASVAPRGGGCWPVGPRDSVACRSQSAVYRGEGTAELLLPGSRKSLHFGLLLGPNRIPLDSIPFLKNLTEKEARVVGCGGPQTARVLGQSLATSQPEEHTCRAAEMKK
jgi:hypothetical protein